MIRVIFLSSTLGASHYLTPPFHNRPPSNSKPLFPLYGLPLPPPPPPNLPKFQKFNFYGTLKGNPGLSSLGAIIRNNKGQIHSLTTEIMGFDTNNSVEIWGLIKEVQLALDHNLTFLIIEGESKVIIDLETKILNGRDPEKITSSWCLLGPLHNVQSLFRPFLTFTTSHIKKSENKVVEKMANVGVDAT
jgi:ribonuclease HI